MKEINGYEGLYAVDQTGVVYSLNYRRTGKVHPLSSPVDTHGYKKVVLSKDKKKKTFYVHRLVAETFLEKTAPRVDHINGNKEDNRVENLRWVTNSVNLLNTKNTKEAGVAYDRKRKKWLGYCGRGTVKRFDTYTEAKAYRQELLKNKLDIKNNNVGDR